MTQERARKLRIFPDEEHPFADHPDLVPWQYPPRRRRIKEPLFDVPDGFEPLNANAYRKRFGHMLSPEKLLNVLESTPGRQSSAIPPAKTDNS
jgi:hypothetical protein